MKKKAQMDNRFMGSVKVGPKGQIVIPKEVRDMFGIECGDTLMLLADAKKGIAIERMGVFGRIADAILSGKRGELYPEHTDEEVEAFAKAIVEVGTCKPSKPND